jgi:hypothetical protein
MSLRGREGLLRAGAALGLLVIPSAQANAGGLGVREQSVYGQGSSFAGVAAGGAVIDVSIRRPARSWHCQRNRRSGIFLSLAIDVGHIGRTPVNSLARNVVAVPVLSGYTSYRSLLNLWFGLSINVCCFRFPDSGRLLYGAATAPENI